MDCDYTPLEYAFGLNVSPGRTEAHCVQHQPAALEAVHDGMIHQVLGLIRCRRKSRWRPSRLFTTRCRKREHISLDVEHIRPTRSCRRLRGFRRVQGLQHRHPPRVRLGGCFRRAPRVLYLSGVCDPSPALVDLAGAGTMDTFRFDTPSAFFFLDGCLGCPPPRCFDRSCCSR